MEVNAFIKPLLNEWLKPGRFGEKPKTKMVHLLTIEK
jgi:hypothetical protein